MKCIGPPTRNFPGTIHIHIPIVSASRECPKGKTAGWSNTSLKIYDFPFRYGPVIDTTQTGPASWKSKEHYKWAGVKVLCWRSGSGTGLGIQWTLSFVAKMPQVLCWPIMIDPFPYQMPLEMLPACTPTLHTLPTREIQVYKHILTFQALRWGILCIITD